MIVDRRLTPHIDWLLLGAVLVLTFVGLMTIYSVTWNIRLISPVLNSGVRPTRCPSRWSRCWCALSSITAHWRNGRH